MHLEKFIEHAEAKDTEVCGLVINFKGKAIYYPCKNIASNPSEDFILDPLDYIKYSTMGDILFICHSHVLSNSNPSKADLISCDSTEIPWLIYSKIDKQIFELKPTKIKQPLLGREYIYNINDCWSLVRDIYKEELNIKLPITVIESDFNWYKDPNKNYFEKYAIDNGFTKILKNSIKKYDIILFKIGDALVPNHLGVYYGDNFMLHHAYNRLSCKEIFGGYWSKSMLGIYRYKDLL